MQMLSLNIGSAKLSKWQMALLIGTPLAVCIGMYAIKKARNSSNDLKKSQSNTLPESGKFSTKKNDTKSDVKEHLTPLEKSMSLKNEGNDFFRNGKYDEAISCYDKAIEICPTEQNVDKAIFYQNRAAAYEMLKKWNKVKEDCTTSIELNPQYAKAYYRRAKAYEATNDIHKCLNDATATCILEKFANTTTIMFADHILKITGRKECEKYIKTRQPCIPSRNFIRTYLKSFVADPIQNVKVSDSSDKLHGYAKARSALEETKYEDVIPACTEEIELSEAESQYKSEALLLRGTIYLLSNAFEEAKDDFDAVINDASATVSVRTNALIKRASLYNQTERKELGAEDLNAAEALQPNNPDIFHQRGQIYLLHDQLNDALIEIEKAIKIAPDHSMAVIQKCYAEYRLALMSEDQMRLILIMNEFRRTVETFPDCVECLILMAQVLCEQQQFDQAEKLFVKAMKIDPTNATLYYHRALMILQWKGDVLKAIELLNTAIEMDGKCGIAYETLGTIEVHRANLSKAIELFDCAIKFAKSHMELTHLFSLRSAAAAQIHVTKILGIDISQISKIAQSNILGGPH